MLAAPHTGMLSHLGMASLFACAAFATLCIHRPIVQAAPPSSVAETLGKARAAVGYDHISKHKHGFFLSGRGEYSGVQATYIMRFTPGGKFYWRVDNRVGHSIGFDG